MTIGTHLVRPPCIAAFALLTALGSACGPSTPPAQQPDTTAAGGAPANGESGNDSRVAEAEKMIAAQQWQSAKSVLETEVSSNPKNAKAVFYLGVCNENLKDRETAEANYKKALELDPKLVDAALNLAALFMDAKDPTSALPYIDQGLAADPHNPQLLQNRALALEDLGKTDEAGKAYAAALEAQPDNSQLRVVYAALLVRTGKKDDALAQLKILVDRAADPVVLMAVSSSFAKLSAFKECVSALDKAAGIKSSSELFARRGVCKHELGDEDGARKDYEQAVAADPKSAPAHYYLGRSLAGSDPKKAIEELNKAVELDTTGKIAKSAKEEIEKLKSAPKGKKGKK